MSVTVTICHSTSFLKQCKWIQGKLTVHAKSGFLLVLALGLDKWNAAEATTKWILLFLLRAIVPKKIKFLSLVKMRLLHQLVHYTKRDRKKYRQTIREGAWTK